MRRILGLGFLGLVLLGLLALPAISAPSWKNQTSYVHGIVVRIDGADYYLAGAPDGPGGAMDIPGHEWKMIGPNKLVGKHYNTGPFGASKWWTSTVDNNTLLYEVEGIIDTWSKGKAGRYAVEGFVHYHELVRVSDGAEHPRKVVWLRHTAVTTFTLDGGPHPELPHPVEADKIDYHFINNFFMPYP